MKILIATGIYPPHVGGPAQYAKNIADVWTKQGHKVEVRIFGQFQKYPWGLRHILFLLYVIPSVIRADYIVALEAFSAGLVTIASKLFSKQVVFRTGGDLLWELYVERTGDLVLLKDFYQTRLHKLILKEKIIFHLMRWTLQNISAIVWSTAWQRDIFMKPYGLVGQKHFIVENFYGEKIESVEPEKKIFIGGTRVVSGGQPLKWKNIPRLKSAFEKAKNNLPTNEEKNSLELDLKGDTYDNFLRKIQGSYAVILVSLGDISPNMILDAIRSNKPFVFTRENGLYERIKDIGIFVDPEDEHDITEKIVFLSNRENYETQKKKIELFTFTHSWQEICNEILAIAKA